MRFLSDLLSEEVAPSRTSGVVLSRTSDVDHSDPVGVEVSGVLTKATTSASSGKRRIREPLKVLQTEGDLPQVEVLQLAKKALHLATSRQLSKTKAITLVTGYAGGGLWAAVAACYDTLQGEL
jgi:hypothetical protein